MYRSFLENDKSMVLLFFLPLHMFPPLHLFPLLLLPHNSPCSCEKDSWDKRHVAGIKLPCPAPWPCSHASDFFKTGDFKNHKLQGLFV